MNTLYLTGINFLIFFYHLLSTDNRIYAVRSEVTATKECCLESLTGSAHRAHDSISQGHEFQPYIRCKVYLKNFFSCFPK